jgi:hypothetical protein
LSSTVDLFDIKSNFFTANKYMPMEITTQPIMRRLSIIEDFRLGFFCWNLELLLFVFIFRETILPLRIDRGGFKTSPQAQFLCWAEGFNTRNIKYIPVVESLAPP